MNTGCTVHKKAGHIEQRHHFLTIQFGLKGKVKLVNALDKGEPRYLQLIKTVER